MQFAKVFSPFFYIIMCVNTLYKMSIRKYFKPVQKGVSLPNRHGPLSSKVPPRAIEAANDRVSEIIKPSRSGSGNTSNTARGPYTKLTPAQRLMIGKRASEHGTTATVNHAPCYTTLHRVNCNHVVKCAIKGTMKLLDSPKFFRQ